jgi:hypothetical protein
MFKQNGKLFIDFWYFEEILYFENSDNSILLKKKEEKILFLNRHILKKRLSITNKEKILLHHQSNQE